MNSPRFSRDRSLSCLSPQHGPATACDHPMTLLYFLVCALVFAGTRPPPRPRRESRTSRDGREAGSLHDDEHLPPNACRPMIPACSVSQHTCRPIQFHSSACMSRWSYWSADGVLYFTLRSSNERLQALSSFKHGIMLPGAVLNNSSVLSDEEVSASALTAERRCKEKKKNPLTACDVRSDAVCNFRENAVASLLRRAGCLGRFFPVFGPVVSSLLQSVCAYFCGVKPSV